MTRQRNLLRKYPHLQVDFGEFVFPERLKENQLFLKTEEEFEAFIRLNPWLTRRLGWKKWFGNGQFPDLHVTQLWYESLERTLRVELEYELKNFHQHGHQAFGCDLIVTFIRPSGTPTYKGRPVWSFYKKVWGEDTYVFCLHEDIKATSDTPEKDSSEREIT